MKRPDCKVTFFIGKNNYNGPKKPPPGQYGKRIAVGGRAFDTALRMHARVSVHAPDPEIRRHRTGRSAFRPINSAKPNEGRARGNIDSGHAHGNPRSGIAVVSGEKRRDET